MRRMKRLLLLATKNHPSEERWFVVCSKEPEGCLEDLDLLCLLLLDLVESDSKNAVF